MKKTMFFTVAFSLMAGIAMAAGVQARKTSAIPFQMPTCFDDEQLTVTNLGSNHPYLSSFGVYEVDDSGNPVSGQIIWANTKDPNAVNEMVTVNQNERFFIIPDGYARNRGLHDDDLVTFENNGQTWFAVKNGTPLAGSGGRWIYFSDSYLNFQNAVHAADSSANGNLNWEVPQSAQHNWQTALYADADFAVTCEPVEEEENPIAASSSATLQREYVSAPVTKKASAFTIAQTLSDQAQRTTLAFSGLAMMTGNLEAQSFFPPGKVADYTGFQYLRDNDPDGMGHNTSFLTRVANNVIYILTDSQFAQLKTLAVAQLDQINLYAYKRFPLMKAFRRLLDGTIPVGSKGLNLNAVKQASRELYLIDGQISFDRALLYANLIKSMSTTQAAYLGSMKGKGWNSWPNITSDKIAARMKGLPQGTAVAVMTYASDLFSWYAGSVEADVYFCPERQGTYYGSFYIKDAPAIGREGYGINEQLTATAGAALSDSTKGYVTQAQATMMSSLVDMQRNNLYASSTANIVKIRTEIATQLRSLLASTTQAATVKARVLQLSGIYGDLDGENNYNYANVFTKVYKTLSTSQKAKLATLRKSIMSGTYADGTAFDFSVTTRPFLYSSAITDVRVLAPYVSNTDYLFFEPLRSGK